MSLKRDRVRVLNCVTLAIDDLMKMTLIKNQNDSICSTNLAIEKFISEVSARVDNLQTTIVPIKMERKQISFEITKLDERCETLDR